MRSSNAYVQLDPAVIEQARQMDLLSYLRAYEPSNLKRVAGNIYCTSEHDSQSQRSPRPIRQKKTSCFRSGSDIVTFLPRQMYMLIWTTIPSCHLLTLW